MFSHFDYSDRIIDMQRDLIERKTGEFLDSFTCSEEAREQLHKMIASIVYYRCRYSFQRFSIYRALIKMLGQSERTHLDKAKKAIEDIIMDNQTREVLKNIGLRGEVKTANFLKAAVKEVEKKVKEEKKKSFWIG